MADDEPLTACNPLAGVSEVARPDATDVLPDLPAGFALATDKETLADVALRGFQFPATGGFVPPGMLGHSAGIGLPYHPDRARELLAEAVSNPSFRLPFIY